jgi:hypothetical protein
MVKKFLHQRVGLELELLVPVEAKVKVEVDNPRLLSFLPPGMPQNLLM